MFSLVCALASPASAEGCPPLFGWFTGSTAQSDFSRTCMSAVRFVAFADRPWSSDQGVLEISRFSCMLFLSVRGFSDYAGPNSHSRFARLPYCISSSRNGVGILIYGLFAAQSPRPPVPLSTLQETPRGVPSKTRGQDGFATSFSVGLLHPLQLAGLARRTQSCPSLGSNSEKTRCRICPVFVQEECFPSFNSLLCPVRIQVERRLQLTSMTSCAIDEWIPIFDAVDVSQEIKDNGMSHLRHIAGDLLGFLVVPLPLARNMAMSTTRAQKPAVTHLHNLQQIPRRHPGQDLDVLEHGFRRLVFLASDLLGEFGNFVVVELLNRLRSGRFSEGVGSFFLLAVRDSNSEQRNQPQGLGNSRHL